MNKLDYEFIKRFDEIEKEYDELNELVNSVEVISDNKLYGFYKAKFDKIEKIAKDYKIYKTYEFQIAQNDALLKEEKDVTFLNEIKQDTKQLQIKSEEIFAALKQALKDLKLQKKEKAKIEVTFKSGSKENLLIIINLFENYSKMFKANFEIEKQTETSVVITIEGDDAFEDLSLFIGNSKVLQFEKETIFSISVLKLNENEIEIDADDIKVETLKSGGAGGQHINKTESAIRLIHVPTGISVMCQDERSQLMNKERAFENLKIKIKEFYSKKEQNEIKSQRQTIKNALFSSTPTTIFDFDKNVFYCLKTRRNYKLKEICDGNIKQIVRDVI